jgi:hypothetical protein
LWHSTLTEEDSNNLERVQKNACRNILKERYLSYENAILVLRIPTLSQRRELLLYDFGKKCLYLDQMKHLFSLKEKAHCMNTRKEDKFHVLAAKTERLKNSTVPYLRKILNEKYQENMNKRNV